MKDLSVRHYGVTDFVAGSPRETLRTAASLELIAGDLWMDMLRDRNRLTHDYDGSLAKELFPVILGSYLPLLEAFRQKAGTILEDTP